MKKKSENSSSSALAPSEIKPKNRLLNKFKGKPLLKEAFKNESQESNDQIYIFSGTIVGEQYQKRSRELLKDIQILKRNNEMMKGILTKQRQLTKKYKNNEEAKQMACSFITSCFNIEKRQPSKQKNFDTQKVQQQQQREEIFDIFSNICHKKQEKILQQRKNIEQSIEQLENQCAQLHQNILSVDYQLATKAKKKIKVKKAQVEELEKYIDKLESKIYRINQNQ